MEVGEGGDGAVADGEAAAEAEVVQSLTLVICALLPCLEWKGGQGGGKVRLGRNCFLCPKISSTIKLFNLHMQKAHKVTAATASAALATKGYSVTKGLLWGAWLWS